MRIAVLGAGSLGLVVGAMLTKKGFDVTLIDGYRAHVDALNSKGATIYGKMDLKVPVKAYHLDNIEGQFDIVFYLGKAQNDSTYLPAIVPHLHQNSTVCTFQNGIPDMKVAAYVGKERTIGGIISWGGSLREPGVVEFISDPAKQTYEIGEFFSGGSTPRLKEINTILDNAGYCEITEDFVTMRWTKLCINAGFSGMSAALGCIWGEILANEKALFCVANVNNELIKVAHAQGIKLAEVQGVNFDELAMENPKAEIASKVPLYRKFYTPHSNIIASMLFDLRLGRKCEIDVINGEVTYWGDKLGIDTPFNDKIVELVKEAEAQGKVPTFDNLARFDEIIANIQ